MTAIRNAMTTNQYRSSVRLTASRVARALLLSTAILVTLAGSPLAQGTVIPNPKFFATDNNGDPCNACKLYTYAAGTTTPQSTYTTSTLTVANANPVVLDSSGRATIFLGALSFKFVLKTSADVTLWTVDGVSSTSLNSTAVGFELASMAGDPNVPIIATTYPVGTGFDKVHAGTLLFSINSANIPAGTYALEGMLIGNGGTVSASLVNISDGNPETPLVTITSTSTTGERQLSTAITFAAVGTAKVYAVKVKTSAGYGRAWALRIVRIS